MRRSPKLAGCAIALAVAGASLMPSLASAAAPQPAPPARASALGLDDGLGATVGGLLDSLLGTAEQQQLQQVLDELLSGQRPTATALASVRTLLEQLAATPGFPESTADLIDAVAALLGGDSSAPLPAGTLAPVATLLHQLADTQGVPAAASELLDRLGDALDSPGAGLPVDQLTLAPTVDAALTGVRDALLAGQPLTGTLLAPLVPLLQQIADTAGLPPALADLADQLASTVGATTGEIEPAAAGELATLLSLAARTAGVSDPTRVLLRDTAAAISPSQPPASGAAKRKRTATAADRARIRGVRLNRAHTVARVRIACPRRAPAVCATRVAATLGGRRAATAKRVRVGPGKAKLVRLRTVPTARATIADKGGWLRVRVTTTFGARHFTAKRALRLAPPR